MAVLMSLAASVLMACAPAQKNEASVNEASVADNIVDTAQAEQAFEYISMDAFSHDLAKFVGLVEGESFAQAEVKINAVFKAYDGHAKPRDIRMDAVKVEAGWKQVLVTQDGLLDGTVTAQQLLAIFDDEQKLVSYGMRIKCNAQSGSTDWQTDLCE